MSQATKHGSEKLRELVLTYMPDADTSRLDKAWQHCVERNEGHKHFSGNSHASHAIEVACTLAKMQLDIDTIISGLLHGELKSDFTLEDLAKNFGDDVASIVHGATRINNVKHHNKLEGQAEGVRKMLLAIASDIRVLLVKLVDRLVDMYSLDHYPREKQLEVAYETMNLYAPLASRLGIDWLKRDLEDYSFKYLYPFEYGQLNEEMESSLEERESYVEEMRSCLRDILERNEIAPKQVLGRPKHLYSIYKKLVAQNIALEKVYDKVAFRIIVENVKECYECLGVVHGEWVPVPGRIKDFISVPKPNNYQSLHTTVAGPRGHFVEIQIRTEEMDRTASEGVAAHWAYKEGRKSASQDARLFSDLKNLVKNLKDVEDPGEFLDTVKDELFDPDVYVLTPGGEVKEFPLGSCPIDFAYSVHTEVGNKCTGAKVNGRLVPLKYQLQTGDILEIITAPSQHPRVGWLDFVKTGRARARIRSWLRREETEKALKVGREICERELRIHNGSLKKLVKTGNIRLLLKALRCNALEDMLVKVGSGAIPIQTLLKALIPPELQHEKVGVDGAMTEQTSTPSKQITQIEHSQDGLTIAGVEGMLVSVSQCCRPVPGDEIAGYITNGRGVTVHKTDCLNLISSDPSRRIDVAWADSGTTNYRAMVHVLAENNKGIFSEVSAVLSGENITMVEITARITMEDMAEFTISMDVKDKDQLQLLMTKLRQMPEVINVRRL